MKLKESNFRIVILCVNICTVSRGKTPHMMSRNRGGEGVPQTLAMDPRIFEEKYNFDFTNLTKGDKVFTNKNLVELKRGQRTNQHPYIEHSLWNLSLASLAALV